MILTLLTAWTRKENNKNKQTQKQQQQHKEKLSKQTRDKRHGQRNNFHSPLIKTSQHTSSPLSERAHQQALCYCSMSHVHLDLTRHNSLKNLQRDEGKRRATRWSTCRFWPRLPRRKFNKHGPMRQLQPRGPDINIHPYWLDKLSVAPHTSARDRLTCPPMGRCEMRTCEAFKSN